MDTPEKRRWYRPTPGWLVLGSLAMTGLLFLSERWRWFSFNEHKGYTVLVAVAGVGVVLASMLLWWLAALSFRLRFQFSIRSLLLLTVAVAIVGSWFAVKTREAKHKQQATEAILKLKGVVVYDYELGAPIGKAKPAQPAWLRRLAGGDFFDRVTIVHLPGDDAAELGPLQDLPELSTLWIIRCDFTDAGLAGLEGLHRLSSLRFFDPAVNLTDDGLAHLEHLKRLTSLTVNGPKITDAGLKHLEGLCELEELELAGSGITDAGLTHLQPLRKLRKLVILTRSSSDPSGIARSSKVLEQLQSPTILEFQETPLSDVFAYLQDLHGIKVEIDEAALKEAKVDRSDSVTCTCVGKDLYSALSFMLDPLGLAWHIGPRGLIITSKAAYAKQHPNLLRLKQTLPNLKEVEVDW